jgi:hypothetical protein
MIGDDQRGYAWTRALLGLPANEVHVCGDLSAVDLVRALAASCGDEFELVTYDRCVGDAAGDTAKRHLMCVCMLLGVGCVGGGGKGTEA